MKATWKGGLIVSHVNYDGLVRRLFVVLCVHEVRAKVQQEDSSLIFLLQTQESISKQVQALFLKFGIKFFL